MWDPSEVSSAIDKKYGLVDTSGHDLVIPTGSRALDRALGIGGYPTGRIVEIYGPEGGGKSTLAMHACAEAQKMGLPFGYVDMEAALDDEYFRKIGVRGERGKDWIAVRTEYGEQAFSVVEDLIGAGCRLVVVDSVATMVPKAELEGEMGESFMGLQARMMGQGLRKLLGKVASKQVLVIFINQTRQKIGVTFGNPEVTTGGNALKFYSTIRLEVRQVGEPIEENDEQVGRCSSVLVRKNKVAPPMKKVLVPILWGRGVYKEFELLDELLTAGIVGKSSSYFTFPGSVEHGFEPVKVNGRRAAMELVAGRYEQYAATLDRRNQ